MQVISMYIDFISICYNKSFVSKQEKNSCFIKLFQFLKCCSSAVTTQGKPALSAFRQTCLQEPTEPSSAQNKA